MFRPVAAEPFVGYLMASTLVFGKPDKLQHWYNLLIDSEY